MHPDLATGILPERPPMRCQRRTKPNHSSNTGEAPAVAHDTTQTRARPRRDGNDGDHAPGLTRKAGQQPALPGEEAQSRGRRRQQ